MALMIVVLGVAIVLVLYVADAISKQNMTDVLVKGGWVLLIITAAMVLVGFIRNAGQK